MLTGEPPLVAAAAALLEAVLSSNEGAMARLYLTGAFFFGLAYVRGAGARAGGRGRGRLCMRSTKRACMSAHMSMRKCVATACLNT